MMPSNHLLKTNYVFPHEWLDVLVAALKHRALSLVNQVPFASGGYSQRCLPRCVLYTLALKATL